MADNRFINVTITKETAATSQEAFNTVLLVGSSATVAFQTLESGAALTAISAAFGEGSEEYKLAQSVLGQSPKISKISFVGFLQATATDPAPLITGLDNLVKSQNDFYYVVCPNHTNETITALSAWVATKGKYYGASTSDQDLGDTLNSDNTFILVHNNPGSYPAEGLIGTMAPRQIGTATWTFKSISGITPVTFDSGVVDAIIAANGVTYISQSGVNITTDGVATSGEWIDIVQTVHYLQARVSEAAFSLFVRRDKIPYDQTGLDLVESEIAGTLQNTPAGMLATDASGAKQFKVTMPALGSVPTNDKANRLLNGVEFQATLAGAIEKINVVGRLQY